jgi:hypothetical protein
MRHVLSGLLRQSVFGRLAGYEDLNDADRLAWDPAVCWKRCADHVLPGTSAVWAFVHAAPEFLWGMSVYTCISLLLRTCET